MRTRGVKILQSCVQGKPPLCHPKGLLLGAAVIEWHCRGLLKDATGRAPFVLGHASHPPGVASTSTRTKASQRGRSGLSSRQGLADSIKGLIAGGEHGRGRCPRNFVGLLLPWLGVDGLLGCAVPQRR